MSYLIRSLAEVCENISDRYEIHFVEIRADENHVHFLIQSVPKLSVEIIVRTIKSITAKELFRRHPVVKAQLWGGNFLTSGYYANKVGQYANEEVIQKYIQNQRVERSEYRRFYKNKLQLSLFE